MRDTRPDGLIQKALSARMRETKEHCANENMMAAYLEAGLSEAETNDFEAHVAGCQECQEILALSMRLQDSETVRRSAHSESRKKTLFRFSIPIPLFGATAAAVLLAVLFLRWSPNSNESKTQVAELRAPAQMTERATPSASAEAPVDLDKREGAPETKQPPFAGRVPEKTFGGRPAGQTAERKKEEFASADFEAAQAVAPPAALDSALPHESAATAAGEERRLESAASPEPPASDTEVDPAPGARAAAAPPARENQRGPNFAEPLSSRMVLNAAPARNDIFGDKDLAQLATAESRKIGDKIFYLNSGIWIDRKSAENREDPVIEMLPGVPEYEKVLRKYPEVRDLVPVLIRWEGKNCLLR